MIRLTRQTDLGIQLLTLVAMREFSADGEPVAVAARELAERSRNPLPSVSKVLKVLAKAELLVSHRGTKGGYELARPAEEISVADMVIALEGPIALTECATDDHSCQQMSWCPVGDNMRIINDAIRDALSEVTLAQMASGNPTSALTTAKMNANDR